MVPRSKIPANLEELHSSPSGRHFGVMKTLNNVRERFFWRKARDDVEKWCRACEACAVCKGPKKRNQGKLQRYNVGASFERIFIDLLGPLSLSTDGNKDMLVALDYFTKWPEVYSIAD